jgi:DNA-binding CsgD family transcriptional regulator
MDTFAADLPLAVGLDRLTDRQRRLVRLLAAGAIGGELAERLGVTAREARHECQAVFAALGVGTPAEAALLWWGSRAGARAEVRLAAERLAAARFARSAHREPLAA